MPSLRNPWKLLIISTVIAAMTILHGDAESWQSQNPTEKSETWEWPRVGVFDPRGKEIPQAAQPSCHPPRIPGCGRIFRWT
jgi:hypothetical protein